MLFRSVDWALSDWVIMIGLWRMSLHRAILSPQVLNIYAKKTGAVLWLLSIYTILEVLSEHVGTVTEWALKQHHFQMLALGVRSQSISRKKNCHMKTLQDDTIFNALCFVLVSINKAWQIHDNTAGYYFPIWSIPQYNHASMIAHHCKKI